MTEVEFRAFVDRLRVAVLNPIITQIYLEHVPTDAAIRLEHFICGETVEALQRELQAAVPHQEPESAR